MVVCKTVRRNNRRIIYYNTVGFFQFSILTFSRIRRRQIHVRKPEPGLLILTTCKRFADDGLIFLADLVCTIPAKFRKRTEIFQYTWISGEERIQGNSAIQYDLGFILGKQHVFIGIFCCFIGIYISRR
ncbi:MAG: hypothetical protein BWY20_02221 [Spirochaetes bacterium ADurb.Bin215]|nr:MAG: hypothetical protein BWY20_02221 [Spirochaetes bacterium ADurb.Bin215]